MREPHLLPLVLQVHLVGEAELDVVDQLRRRATARPARRPRSSSAPSGRRRESTAARRCAGAGGRVGRRSSSCRRRCRPSPSQSTALSATRPTCLASSGVKRRSITPRRHSGSGSARATSTRLPGTGMAKMRLELLDHQVVVELGQRLALQRLGVRRQQLAEELASAPPPASRSAACLRSGPSSAAAAASGTSCGTSASPSAARSSRGRGRRGGSASRGPIRRRRGAPRARAPGSRPAPGSRAGTPAAPAAPSARLQLLHVALLDAQLRLLASRASPTAPVCSTAPSVCSAMKSLELGELGGVELDLVEVALDDLLHQLARRGARNCLPGPSSKSSKAQASEAMRLMKRRTGWRRVEKKVWSLERDAQHRQLQARDLARHLRRHARVGEDLVEQAADDVDHHVIELAGRGLEQLFAVGADQVDRHRPRSRRGAKSETPPRPLIAVLHARRAALPSAAARVAGRGRRAAPAGGSASSSAARHRRAACRWRRSSLPRPRCESARRRRAARARVRVAALRESRTAVGAPCRADAARRGRPSMSCRGSGRESSSARVVRCRPTRGRCDGRV